MKIGIFAAVILLVLTNAAVRAAEPATLPPAVGLSESAANERARSLPRSPRPKATPRRARSRIASGRSGGALPTTNRRQLLEESRQAQLRFDYDEAILYMKELVKHAPQFAEGWNQLGYVYFLAGQYDASLDAIDRVLELEPMHYAALAGKGIILIQQGKVAEAQAPLKRALAIDPWLKERNLIGKDSIPEP